MISVNNIHCIDNQVRLRSEQFPSLGEPLVCLRRCMKQLIRFVEVAHDIVLRLVKLIGNIAQEP